MELKAMSKSELEGFYKQACEEYDGYKAKGLALNMARGKPSAEQLDLTEGMLTAVSTNAECYAEDGTDCRNYGIGDGLPEAKKLFAPMLGVSEDEIMVLGNSSLTIMYDNIAKFMVFGTGNGAEPWSIQA